MSISPKQVAAFAEEYAEKYIALVQCKAANRVLRDENDKLKEKLNKMDLQELLIDGIEFLQTVPGQEERLQAWRDHLDSVNRESGTVPKCATGYYWNGTECVLNVGG